MNSIRQSVRGWAATAAFALCLGSAGSVPAAPDAATAVAPGGLYVGYYQEDPLTNPEDPTPGAFTLNLPDADSAFSGSMFFTYVGCQTSNVGTITGNKAGAKLSGTWSGTIDGSLQKGPYAGVFDPATGGYTGTYANSAGKQFRDLSPCISYWIAPNGSWEMFPVEHRVPAGFDVTVNGRTIAWNASPGGRLTLVYVIDTAIAQTRGNPVLWQTLAFSGTRVAIPPTVALQTGKTYVAAVTVTNADSARVAFGSRRFTP